jgi:hypothetical protein
MWPKIRYQKASAHFFRHHSGPPGLEAVRRSQDRALDGALARLIVAADGLSYAVVDRLAQFPNVPEDKLPTTHPSVGHEKQNTLDTNGRLGAKRRR